VAHAKDEDVITLDQVLKEIRKDVEAFKSDPKGKVPDLSEPAAKAFSEMPTAELTGLAEADSSMAKVGYKVTSGGVSVRMV
jgi:hypothetical protein